MGDIGSTAIAGGKVAVEKGTPQDFPKSSGAVKALNVVGKALGVVGAFNAWSEFADSPSAGKFAKAAVSTGLIFVKSSVIGLATSLLDVYGITDKLFEGW